MRRLPLLASVPVFAVSLACASGESVLEDNREAAQARLENMRKAVTAALADPVGTPPDLPEKLRIQGEDPNAYLVQPEWIADPPRPPEHNVLTPASEFITIRNLLLGSESPTGVADYYRQAFSGFLSVKWLVVVDPSALAGGALTSDTTFVGGGFAGTLHFVDIEAGKSVGTLPVDASASDEVEVAVDNEAKHLASDVWMNARAAIGKTLAPHLAAGQKPL